MGARGNDIGEAEQPRQMDHVSSVSAGDINASVGGQADKEFAKTQPPSRSANDVAQSSHANGPSLGRMGSQNGYGCDGDNSEDKRDAQDVENGPVEKDSFEVTWENGDNDPLNPKSKSKAAKWLIVLLCAFASLCV